MNLRAYLILYLLGMLACGAPQKHGKHQVSDVRRLEVSCEKEHAVSCFRLGLHFKQHDMVTNRRSKRAFRRGCDLGHGGSCIAFAELWQSEKEQLPLEDAKQSRRIEALYRQACELGEQRGCVKASTHLFMHAQRRAAQLGALGGLKRSCDASGGVGYIELLRAQL
ncbi:MAG: hypothetical protein ACPGQS_14015, partial [Bradymonadia bacterium]